MKELSGQPVATKNYELLMEILTRLGRKVPALASVAITHDPDVVAYTRSLRRRAERVGVHLLDIRLPPDSSTADVTAFLRSLNEDREVDGILLHRPLPRTIDQMEVVDSIDPARDVDGMTFASAGRALFGEKDAAPAPAAAVLDILAWYGIGLANINAVVMGSSPNVGLPIANLLVSEGATVTVVNRNTKDIEQIAKGADLLVTVIGRAGVVDQRFVKHGAVVVDVGISEELGVIKGDVDIDSLYGIASAVTPVPGGVGPVTTSIIFLRTAMAALARG